jgi:acetyltransferase-like isoleucine patch superfamily enzyme
MIRFLAKIIKGPEFEIDRKISHHYIFNLSLSLIIRLIKGLAILQKPVFIGKNVRIICKEKLLIEKYSKISEGCYLDAMSTNGLTIGKNASIGAYTRIECTGSIKDIGSGIKIGQNFGIGAFSFIGAAGGVKIGDDVIMGQYVSFHSENHIFTDHTTPIRLQGITRQGIKLGNNIWVGSKVTFLDGAEVSDNSVIAAGAVVKDRFPPNVVIAGTPAKVVRNL